MTRFLWRIHPRIFPHHHTLPYRHDERYQKRELFSLFSLRHPDVQPVSKPPNYSAKLIASRYIKFVFVVNYFEPVREEILKGVKYYENANSDPIRDFFGITRHIVSSKASGVFKRKKISYLLTLSPRQCIFKT